MSLKGVRVFVLGLVCVSMSSAFAIEPLKVIVAKAIAKQINETGVLIDASAISADALAQIAQYVRPDIFPSLEEGAEETREEKRLRWQAARMDALSINTLSPEAAMNAIGIARVDDTKGIDPAYEESIQEGLLTRINEPFFGHLNAQKLAGRPQILPSILPRFLENQILMLRDPGQSVRAIVLGNLLKAAPQDAEVQQAMARMIATEAPILPDAVFRILSAIPQPGPLLRENLLIRIREFLSEGNQIVEVPVEGVPGMTLKMSARLPKMNLRHAVLRRCPGLDEEFLEAARVGISPEELERELAEMDQMQPAFAGLVNSLKPVEEDARKWCAEESDKRAAGKEDCVLQ